MKSWPQRLLHEPLLAAAAAHPGKVAVRADGVSHTYAELLAAASSLARVLQERGVRRGDRVAIYLENGWPCVVSIYATLLAGAAIVVINPRTRPEKLAFVVEDCEAALLIMDDMLLEDAGPLPASLAEGRPHICCGDFDAILAATPPAPADPGLIPLDLAALIYTSGSTGHPKGVMMTHQSMLFAAGSIAEYLRLDTDDRILNVLPLAFDYGLYQLLLASYLGATLVLERGFSYPAQTAERVREEEVTVFPGVPTIFAALRSLHRGTPLALPSVRRVTNTAAALPPEFLPQCREIFPNALIFSMYGLTECKRVSYLEPEELARRPTSVGRAIPGTEVFLLSHDGQPVSPGEPGLLHVRGPHLMRGYWKQPELSAAVLVPGPYPGERILCTRDYFRLDDEGFLYFIGRTDDIIKTRGEKVSPVEIENVLHAIPGVREAAVVGVPDELLGQAIHAYVVLDEGATLGVAAIKRHCRQKLEPFMVPRAITIVPELPTTQTAKVRKQDLMVHHKPA